MGKNRLAGEGRGAVPAALAVGRHPSFRSPRLAAGRLFWLEQRPREGGRTTLLVREGTPQGAPEGTSQGGAAARPIELTPGSWNLRSRVHEYGGGVYAVAGSTVVFVDDGDRCLWSLDLPRAPLGEGETLPPPRRLTAEPEATSPRAFADGLIDHVRDRWLGVMEQAGRDRLVAVPLNGGEPEPLHTAADFCGYAVLSPSGSHLAWVEWQQPFMPWERSQLWLGAFDSCGALASRRCVAGSDGTSPQGISVFQPLWAGGDLVVANDRSGWWNLERLVDAESIPWGETGAAAAGESPQWQPLMPMPAEFGQPQWVYGMATTAWDGSRLLAAACREGRWELGSLAPAGQGEWTPLDLPFTDLGELHATDGRLVAIAASPTTIQGLLELDTDSGDWCHTPSAPCPLAPARISVGEPLWFEGHGLRPTQAWYYPPPGGGGPETPLLVKSHSGPTGMAGTGLNLAVQFWTSRGWGVVDVNYGGSTGFGRAYRERLDGLWGVVDVADCAAAALAVVRSGKASAERIAIEGGSAGGFTVLAALCFSDVFRAGACRYAVADLAALTRETHRFEARYLDTLVGPWPAAKEIYEARSPLVQAHRIRCPVIFFQGLEDRVVPPEQTERMALALSANSVPVEVHLFPGEGHGFRASEVRIRVLEATEAFFGRHFTL